MQIKLLVVGKTDKDYVSLGMDVFEKRLSRYIPFEVVVIPALKNTKNKTPQEFKIQEGKQILKYAEKADKLILLDEAGKSLSSVGFSKQIQYEMNIGTRLLMFVVGGAFGFSDEVYDRADAKMALSSMTFSHQMVRLFFMEQVYRSFTILRNEPYHNE